MKYLSENIVFYKSGNSVRYINDEALISLSNQLEGTVLFSEIRNTSQLLSSNTLDNTLLQGNINAVNKLNSSSTLQPVAIVSQLGNKVEFFSNFELEGVSLNSQIDPEFLQGFNTHIQLASVSLGSNITVPIETLLNIDVSDTNLTSETNTACEFNTNIQLEGVLAGSDIDALTAIQLSNQLDSTDLSFRISPKIKLEFSSIDLESTTLTSEFEGDENFKSNSQLQSTGMFCTMQIGRVLGSVNYLEDTKLSSIIGEAYPSFYIEPYESSSDEIDGNGTLFRTVESGKVVRTTKYKEVYRFTVIHDGMELSEVQELDEFYERNKSVKFVFNWPLDRSGQIIPYEVNFVKPQRVVDYYPLQRKMEVEFIGQRLV